MKISNTETSQTEQGSTTEIRVEPIYISAGCNRCPKAVDWGGKQNQLICSFTNSVALYTDREPFEIKCTFNKHTERVNCVKWIGFSDLINKNLLNKNEFLSASKDKTIVLWQGSDYQYDVGQCLDSHKDSVCVVDGMYFEEYKSSNEQHTLTTLIASASVDSTVRIWSRHSNYSLDSNEFKFAIDQVITTKMNGFALALKFYLLPTSNLPVLLIGYENHKIELNVRLHNETDNSNKFFCLHTLIGHEDWIRDIDVCQLSTQQLLIASCSQDNYIRLWKLDSSLAENKEEINAGGNGIAGGLIIEENSAAVLLNDSKSFKVNGKDDNEDDDDDELPVIKNEEELKLKSSLFTVHSKKLNKYVQYSINLESVLYGHEDWIYTVKFHPRLANGQQPLVLISASMDKTMVIWKYNEENAVWIDVARAGDIGGNTLGFYGATFEPTGQYIVANGYQGALNLWRRNFQNDALTSGIINSGHFDQVEDICWEPEQHFFLSTSKDQTTRFHSYWKRQNNEGNQLVSWHELGRPQIHGYDMTCVSFLDRFKFVSGADEKLLRIFEAPKIFLKNLVKLNLDESINKLIEESHSMPQGASIPALGLSNKAVFEDEKKPVQEEKISLAEEIYKEVYFNIVDLNKPPTEEHLLQNTLWPEIQKLYGHGYELFSVAVDTKSKLIASACKATKAEHATILLWQEQFINNQRVYKQIDSLKGHELTIVQMKFSNDGQYLLSVSRDRSWKLFKRNSIRTDQFELVRYISSKNSYHTRIIWSCDWSHDDKYFLTTSRDKRACIWRGSNDDDKLTIENTANKSNDDTPIINKNNSKYYLELDSAVTACSFAPGLTSQNKYLVALGLETGQIEFYTWSLNDGFNKFASIENRYSHHLTVKRLSFRKTYNKETNTFHLASCSDDCSVRLFEITA